MAESNDLVYGRIVVVSDLVDPQGRNPKDRPCVVVTRTALIAPDRPLDVVAITTQIPSPLPSDHVLLPWHADRHPRTGLNKRNAAVCSWLAVVDHSRVIRRLGIAPAVQMTAIAINLNGRWLGYDPRPGHD